MRILTVKEIALMAIVTALIVMFSIIKITITANGGGIFLVGVGVFLSPLVLKARLAFIPTLIGVLLADLFGAYQFWYFSLLFYGVGLLILVLGYKLKKNIFIYGIFLTIALLVIMWLYFLLGYITFGITSALINLFFDAIQQAIILVICLVTYYPLKILMRIISHKGKNETY